MRADLHVKSSDPLLLTPMQTARMLGISRRSLEREIARGKFPRPLKIGSSSRFTNSDVTEYLNHLQATRGLIAS